MILYEMKKSDNMASLKILYTLIQKDLNSELVKCQTIRLIKHAMFHNKAVDQKKAKLFLSFIESKLDNKEEECVQFEAARTLCELFEVYGAVVEIEPPF